MNAVNEQIEHANEIAEALANPLSGPPIDEVRWMKRDMGVLVMIYLQDELKDELQRLQEDVLNERLAEADHAPVHLPPGARVVEKTTIVTQQEEDEDAELRELQAALAM